MQTTEPRLRAAIRSVTSRQTLKEPSRLTSRIRCQLSGVSSRNGDRLPDPGDRGERLDRALFGLHGLDGDGDLLPGPHVGPVGGDRASGRFDLRDDVVARQNVERGDRVAVADEAPGDLGAHALPALR